MAEEMVTFDEFKRMKLVVGTVTSVEPHPNADKLYVMKVNLGGEERQLVAGIKPNYEPQELDGKQVVVVANLQPARLRGIESNGMLLAAQFDDDVVVISPERPVPPGAKVL